MKQTPAVRAPNLPLRYFRFCPTCSSSTILRVWQGCTSFACLGHPVCFRSPEEKEAFFEGVACAFVWHARRHCTCCARLVPSPCNIHLPKKGQRMGVWHGSLNPCPKTPSKAKAKTFFTEGHRGGRGILESLALRTPAASGGPVRGSEEAPGEVERFKLPFQVAIGLDDMFIRVGMVCRCCQNS